MQSALDLMKQVAILRCHTLFLLIQSIGSRWQVAFIFVVSLLLFVFSAQQVEAHPLQQAPVDNAQLISPTNSISQIEPNEPLSLLLTPLPAQNPQLEARRQALLLLGEGDALDRRNQRGAAREQWLAAADLYEQADDGLGKADAYLRVANSYLPSVIGCVMAATANPYSHSADSCIDELGMDDFWQMMALASGGTFRLVSSYYVEALFAAAGVYEELIQREIPL